MNVAHFLSKQAAARAGQAAIIEDFRGRERRLTFAELGEQAALTAAMLCKAGLRPGDAALVLQPMSINLYVILIGLFRMGAVPVFLDPSSGRKHIEACCAVQPPRAFIGSRQAHLLRLISPALRRIPIKFSIGGPIPGCRTPQRQTGSMEAPPIHPCGTGTPALIRFTSGSTGRPKAALRTHGFLLEQQRVLAKCLRLEAGETDLATLPIFVLANLAAGVTSIIPNVNLRQPAFINPENLVRQMLEHRPQRIGASPDLLERIADHCASASHKLNYLRKIFTGGAPVFPRLLDKLHAVAPRADIVAVYGSTEAEPIARISHRDITLADSEAMRNGKGLLAGFPVDDIDLRIIADDTGALPGRITDDELNRACVSRNQPGQVVVSGPHVQPGYLNGIGDAETKFQTNKKVWHKTGDAGFLDARGRLWLLGRCHARVVDERGVLHPFQVECAASHQPGVRRSALVSLEGRRVLVIESRNGANFAELKNRLSWAGIDRITVVRRLPVDRRHNSKIDYPALGRMEI